jgi:TnsA endonuclease-like protein
MPVRKISNRGGGVTGRFPSLKMHRMVAFESTIERDYLYILDYDSTITNYEEQPLTITYEYRGKQHRYVPDFRIRQSEREILVECKPTLRVHTDENQRKFAAAQAWCQPRRWEFRVITDTELRQGHRLQNIKRLTYYARLNGSLPLHIRVRDLLATTGVPLPMEVIANELAPEPHALVKAHILNAVFHHRLAMPLDAAPINNTTLVALPLWTL